MVRFNNEDYKKLQKYVVCKGNNWDGDRYIEIVVNDIELILCLNENTRKVMSLSVDGKLISDLNKFIVIKALEQLLDNSKLAEYTAQEEEIYDLYIDEIQPETECPEENENMFVVQAYDWENVMFKIMG